MKKAKYYKSLFRQCDSLKKDSEAYKLYKGIVEVYKNDEPKRTEYFTNLNKRYDKLIHQLCAATGIPLAEFNYLFQLNKNIDTIMSPDSFCDFLALRLDRELIDDSSSLPLWIQILAVVGSIIGALTGLILAVTSMLGLWF